MIEVLVLSELGSQAVVLCGQGRVSRFEASNPLLEDLFRCAALTDTTSFDADKAFLGDGLLKESFCCRVPVENLAIDPRSRSDGGDADFAAAGG
ncbi:hypothetical protein NHN26_10745 [Rhodovulum tesquicola]|nr:hypothetical protein [Rhodovulum tesquicola]MCO8145704.1 hypothetical protein [Rhodovulum tesquicola]